MMMSICEQQRGIRSARAAENFSASVRTLTAINLRRTASLRASHVQRGWVVAADELAKLSGGFHPIETNRSAAWVQLGRLLRAHDSSPQANRIAEVSSDLEVELGSNRERPNGIEEGSREADVLHPKGKDALSPSRMDQPDSRERAVPGIAQPKSRPLPVGLAPSRARTT